MKRVLSILASLLIFLSISSTTLAAELPEEIEQICNEAGREFDIAPPLLMSIVWQESRGTKTNKTQITNTKWFKEGIEYCKASDPKRNDEENIRICAYYLNKWFRELGDADVYLIIECWNEGYENAIATHNDLRPSKYAKEVVDRATEWTEELEG